MNPKYRRGVSGPRVRKSGGPGGQAQGQRGLGPRGPRRIPLRLPFDPQRPKGDWVDWAYRHRFGVLISVFCYFTLAVSFLACRFEMNPTRVEIIEIQLENEQEKLIEQLQQKQQEIQQIKTHTGQMRNEIADNRSTSETAMRRPDTPAAQELYDDVKRLQDDLAQGVRDYQESVEAIEQAARQMEQQRQASNVQAQAGPRDVDKMARGNVAATFDLEGRTARYIHIPAYKCRGGGVVVVNIAVNRDGEVTGARVESGLSTSDRCLEQEAVNSAKRSRFNVSYDSPVTQRGTLTYTFVAQ